MPSDLITIVGWIGQAMFFARFLFQWIASERARRIAVPSTFWWLSLFGSACLFAYALDRQSLIFGFGAAANFMIYLRLIMLDRGRPSLHPALKICMSMIFMNMVVWLATSDIYESNRGFWFFLGVVGQIIWLTRFPIQWIKSEVQGKADLSPTFFWISLVGSSLLLAYAITTRDPIWIAGTILVPIVSIRNLMLGRGPAPLARPQD